MSEGVLFLLCTFIIPIFSIGYPFFKLLKDCYKLCCSEIVLFVIGAFTHLLLGCMFYFDLGSLLKSFVAGNVIMNALFFVVLEIFSFKELKSFIKGFVYSIVYLLNGYFVLFSLFNYNFSNSLMIFILLIYPFISVCQLILYIDEKNKDIKKGKTK